MKKLIFIFLLSITSNPLFAAFVTASVGDCTYTSIDDYTCKVTGLYNWSATDITIPASITVEGNEYTVTNIGFNAFSRATQLKIVTLPPTVKTIESNAFYEIPLQKINLENVECIESNAFDYCNQLTDIGSLASLTTMGSRAFYGTGLTHVEIPGSLKILPTMAFTYCKNLTEITLNEGLEIIQNPFGDELETLSVPASVISFQARFNETSHLKSLRFLDGEQPLEISYGLGSIGIVIPNFEYLYVGRNITLVSPSSLTALQHAQTVEFGPFVTSLPDWSFRYFNNLKSVYIGPSIISIPTGAFSNCHSLSSVTFSSSVERIGLQAFYNNAIETISFPSNIKYIGESAFSGCESLQSIDFGEGVEAIDEKAFSNCTAITSLSIPENITNIGFDAFYGMKSLKSLKIEDSSIPLEILTKSNDYGYAGERALFGNTALTEAYIGRNFVTSYPQAGIFKSVNSLETITVGDMVTELPEYALTVGYNEPGYSETCALKEVILGKNLEKIGYGAIRFNPDYDGNASIMSYNTVPPEWLPDANGYYTSFYGNVDLYVPEVALLSYSSSNVWSGFSPFNIFPIDNAGIEEIDLDNSDLNIYDLQGHHYNSTKNLKPGIYIIKSNGKTLKIIL